MATPAAHLKERQAYAEFASLHAEEDYRGRLAELYPAWRELNKSYFDGRLVEPHLAIGRTAPRSLGHAARTTDYGGRLQIVLNAGLVFGTNRDWVVNAWPPAEGTRRFIDDLLLRLTVRQYVLENLGLEESGYRGFGPRFVEQANRIGVTLGLPPVVERRRGTHTPEPLEKDTPEPLKKDTPEPLAHCWPHSVRPAGYYLDDVTEHVLELASGLSRPRPPATPAPTEGLLELLLYLLKKGRAKAAQTMITRHLEWVRRCRESRMRPRRRAEEGKEDTDGEALGEVTFDRAWLEWNGGTVLRIAQAVYADRSFWALPVLADALEEAGCTDGRILRHLRESMEHSRRCWVLRILLALDGAPVEPR